MNGILENLGTFSTVATVVVSTVYLISFFRVSPKLVVRLANSHFGDHLCFPNLINPGSGEFIFGISTKRKTNVKLIAIKVYTMNAKHLKFLGNELFEVATPIKNRWIPLEWKGEKNLENKKFTIFNIPYEAPANAPIIMPIIIDITAVIRVEESLFPWHLVSIHPQTRRFKQVIRRVKSSDETLQGNFMIAPGESAELFGGAAEKQIDLHSSGEINAYAVEIFKDGSYRDTQIKGDSAPSSQKQSGS